MDIQHLTDDARLRLAVVAPVLLMTAAGLTATALGALGSTSGARAALGLALASSFPVLVGTFTLSSASGHRLLRVGLAAAAIVTLLSVALARPALLGV